MNIQALTQIGNYWAKGQHERIYFEITEEALGLKINRYNTGNISGATLNGETISNAKARKMLHKIVGAKFWYDLKTEDYEWKNTDQEIGFLMMDWVENRVKEIEEKQPEAAVQYLEIA